MTEATLSAKNQIVIPRAAREALRAKPGDRLVVIVRGDRVIVLVKPNPLMSQFGAWLAASTPALA
jgi:AbrB family looped-hinge helix DNA binding protein